MSNILVIIALLCSANIAPGSQTTRIQGAIERNVALPYLRDFEPKSIKSNDDLPEKVLALVSDALREKVGDEFASRVRLERGFRIDREELLRQHPDFVTALPGLSHYYLVYSFADLSAGILAYRFLVELDWNGTLKRPIELPEIARNPTLGRFVSVENTIASSDYAAGLKGVGVELAFDQASGEIVYRYRKLARESGTRLHFRVYLFSAHDGRLIRMSRETEYR